MKISVFKVFLNTFLACTISSGIMFLLMLLIFNDELFASNHRNEIPLLIIAEVSGIVFFSATYLFSFLLPAFYIKKKRIAEKTAVDLFNWLMPLVSFIASVFAFFVLLIGEPYNGVEGEVWINIWLVYFISFFGLVAFVYNAKKSNS